MSIAISLKRKDISASSPVPSDALDQSQSAISSFDYDNNPNPAASEHALLLPKKASLRVDDQDDLYRNSERILVDTVTPLFAPPKSDYTYLTLKPDHQARPIWVCDDGKIILEAFSSLSSQAQDFLTTISEPVTRPSRVHEYKLTAYSLYAAVSVGMETSTIIEVLERFSKVKVPDRVVRFIKDCTVSYGKVKLVLKHNRYFIESSYPETLRLLLRDETIKRARVVRDEGDEDDLNSLLKKTHKGVGESKLNSGAGKMGDGSARQDSDDFGAVITLDREDDQEDDGMEESDFSHSFEIAKEAVEDVKKQCRDLDYPLMEEYDFRNDDVNPNLDMDLSPKTIIRDYQEKSLSKMFGGGGGRARSGIIVLPTGAGKTLVGITAACTVKKSTLVLCTNAISVEQWSNEFKNWTTIQEGKIAKFTADQKAKFAGDAGIVISTYTMISHSGKRAWDTQRMLEFINSREWGLLILDEVHVVPANVFRRVLTTVAAHTKLGLTATLVREDDKIEDLNFLIGPKLFEANWMDLAGRGHIAKVEATEIWCGMDGKFYKHYLESTPGKRRLLCAMNPTKFRACEYLIRWREREGDKIIVFSDNVCALKHYATKLGRPYIFGETHIEERKSILNRFRQNDPRFRTIFLSKVGDTSLDLPEATCLIQISSQFGSRRQEAQRMGRILRAKRRNEEGFKSRFYTLVCKDTDEVAFSAKRRRFLVDQGYEFHIIPSADQLIPPNLDPPLHYSVQRESDELLCYVQDAGDADGDDEFVRDIKEDDLAGVFQHQQIQRKRMWGSSARAKSTALAQAEERKRLKREADEREKRQNPLFRAWRRSGV
ncbi:P-loop containing nucleoside triphosphate hydrolase protein [Polychytrium aggregatum]|uniref:P-loop containing nucleoside triphosphate hydrolase protein n=1 Tax=Polychytrium aggregatum TaxID=110093 RepID=UPI0022FE866F|nr:P-loop containing nucleoside triphosphate hydrolase protein [Polychytrium aggregatum]KAI9205000.1 P-loop containing nucleoside triphosphate hydrolase protein [Polychytrium aggregatum]